MTQPDKDDLADALARMAAGEETDAQSDEIPLDGLDETPATPTPSLFRKEPATTVPPSAVRTPQLSEPPAPARDQRDITPTPAATPRVRPSAPPTRPATPNLTPPDQVQQEIVNLSRPAPPPRRAGPPPVYNRLGFRRTIIPILLTLGVLLPALGSLPFIATADSPFAAVQPPVAITFIAIGVILLLAAMVNMIQVKHEISAAKP
jgi:hypothetical protein